MKKFLAMVLGMVMVLSMVGCGKSDTPTTTDTTTSVSTESSVEVSTETSTEVIPHTERVQETVEVESAIDKENACAIDTIYFTVEKTMTTITTYDPSGKKEMINYFEIDTNNFGKEMKCDVYYFVTDTMTVDEVVGYSETGSPIEESREIAIYKYEYEISPVE